MNRIIEAAELLVDAAEQYVRSGHHSARALARHQLAALRSAVQALRDGGAEPTGFIFRSKQQVSEAESVEPGQPHDHLWVYMHGTKYLSRMESLDGLEVVRLLATPPTQDAQWQPIETAPKDGTPIVGWCVHAADPYYLEDGNRLTIYGGHTEGLSHVKDGPHVVVWGGAFDDSTIESPGACMPDWWFLYGSSFEVTANPTHWMPLPAPPATPKEGSPT